MQVQFDECQVTSDELQVKLDVTGGLRPTGLTAAREAVLAAEWEEQAVPPASYVLRAMSSKR